MKFRLSIFFALFFLFQLLFQNVYADVDGGFVLNPATKECVYVPDSRDEYGIFYDVPEGCIYSGLYSGKETYYLNHTEICEYYGFNYGLNESECYKGKGNSIELKPVSKTIIKKIILLIIVFSLLFAGFVLLFAIILHLKLRKIEKSR